MHKKQNIEKKPSLLWSLLSAFAYGLWAFFINSNKLGGNAFVSAFIQFLLSFSATSFLTFSMVFLLRISSSYIFRVLAAIIPMNVVALTFYIAHAIARTPQIIRTILPSYIIGHIFCFTFVYFHIRRNSRRC